MADPNSVNPYEQIWKTRDLRALETPLELENKLSSFERGVGRFKEQMKGTGYGLAALASQGVQNVIGENPVTQGITDWGLEGYNETTVKSQPGAIYAPKVAKVEDIKTPSGALEWGAGLLGEQLPLAGSLLLTGGIGGAVARMGANAAVKNIAGAAVGTAVKKGVEQGALKAVEGELVTDAMRKAASKALLDTTLKGAAITGFAGTAGLEGGQSFGGSVQEGAKPEDAVLSSIAVGGLNGALELLAPFVVAKKMGLGEYAKKSIADIISNDAGLSKKAIALATAKELGARGVKGFAEGAAVEGITEGLQELTSIAGERWAKNSQLFADLTDEDWSQIKNSAAGGAFIGGGLSGAGATVSGPQTEQTKVQTKVTAPAQSKLDVLKANQAKLVEQINETIKAGDTKKAEELQAIKSIYDLAINKTQEVIPAQEKPALEGELVQEPAKETPVSEVAPVVEANAPTLEIVKPTEEEVANGQVQAKTEAPLTEPAVEQPELEKPVIESTPITPAITWEGATPETRTQWLKDSGHSEDFSTRKAVEWDTWDKIPPAIAQQRLPKVMPQEVKAPEVITPEVMAQPETNAVVKPNTASLYSRPLQEPTTDFFAEDETSQATDATMEEFEAVRKQFQEKQSNTPVKQWFGKGTPGITATPEGEPITLYHGTNNPNFYEWDSTRASEASGHPTSGLGFFMTADKGSAARYGSNLLELHAKINNPYALTDADLTSIETPADATALREKLIKRGYDGAVVTAPGAKPYVIAFQKNQIKLTSNKNPTAGSDMRFSKPVQKPASTFYSALERTVQEVKQEKAPAVQWESSLDNMVKKGLIKQEELDWSGTKEWLQGQKEPVTKGALLNHVRDNTLEVQETSLTDNPDVYALGEWVRAENADPNSKTEVLDWKWKGESKPSVTLVKVGENDWHTSLSPERGTLDEVKQEAEDHLKFVARDKFEPRNTTWTLPGGENQRELVLTVPSIEPFNTDDTTHYGDVGGGRAVAWVRFNDRTDEDGKKTLFVEEIQSKRHQEGREEGYKQENPDVKLFDELSAQLIQEQEVLDKFLAEKGYPIDILNELGQFPEQGFDAEKQAIADKYKEVSNFVEQQNVKASELKQKIRDIQYKYEGRDIPSTTAGVPNAPFKQTIAGSGQTLSGWAGLAFKRMLKYAAENGYDKVAWTTGEQQAKRYNLAQSVSKVAYTSDGYFQAYDRNGRVVMSSRMNESEVPNYIGKELTNELFTAPVKEGERAVELAEDKVIGGEGMKGFYDRLLPNEINKYVKKWGAEVTQAQMKFGDESASVHKVKITPAMRDSVMQGQPLFSKQAGKQKTITPEMDAEYLAAVERGDMEAVQRMVNEAAKKTGYDIGPVWHATKNKFTEFNIDKATDELGMRMGEGLGPKKFYFAKKELDSSPKIEEGRLRDKTLRINAYLSAKLAPYEEWKAEFDKQKGTRLQKVTAADAAIKSKGYTGIDAGWQIAVFDATQIKSANPITYDDVGNVVLLSQRFNTTTPDIRYTQQPGTITVPLQDFHANINSVMGEGWLQQAIDLGLVEVIEGPGPNGESGSWSGEKIRLYTGSMPKGGSPAGVLLHEGKHATFADVLGDSLQEYVKDLHTLANNGNKIARDAISHAVLASADTLGIKHNLLNGGNKTDFENLRTIIEARRPGLLAEEELAYFVQYGTEAQGGAGFLRRLINAIKAWFAQTQLGQRMKELGLGFELTDAMAVEWAKMGLNMSLQEAKQAVKVRARIEKQAANMPASARLGKALGALEDIDPLYSMGIKEFQEKLWNDPTDPRIEIVNKPGLLQKFRADFVDYFGEMEKKSKDVYDTYILQRAKKGARIEKSRQTYLLPLRELIANSPWDAKEVGDMLAARHIKIDNVNTDLAERASQGYTKELLKALPDTKRKELTKARVNVKAGKMPDGSVYKDANGNVVDMSARTKRKLMFDLMNQYAPFEIANTAGVQELNQEWEIFKDAAGGFSNGGIAKGIVRTVDNILAPVSKAPAKFDEIANLFDAMNRHTLDILEEGGLITAREHARLLTSKSAYAPLRRESYNIDRETELLFQRTSAGGSKQIGTRAGTANLSEPTLVLQNALAKLEATAAAAERNLANQELYNTIMTDREGWKPWFTIADKDQYVTHDEDGFLQEKHATASSRGDIVLIKDGKKIVIKPNMHNERATGFVRAVNSMDVQALNGPMKVMSWVNSLIRWINISASPIFLMTNLIRDPLTAAYNLQATEAAEYSKDIFLNWKRAFKALKKVYIDNNRDLTDADVKMLEKFEKAGGRTSFVLSLKEMDDNSFSNFEGQVTRRQGSMKYLMKAKDTWLDGIENYNILFENIMRFSTFMTLQEKSNISEQRAARIAQDITTNFSRRGYKSQMLGVWWLFFNASVQGNYQVLRNLMSSKRVQVAVGGTIATAVMLDVLGRALTDDWDEIPEWDKEKNIILPIKVGGDFVKIPAPWVYNVFWRMGGMIGETLAGKRKPQDTILDMAALTFTTLDPLGKPGSIWQAVSPTAFDPFMQIIENKNFAGNPIGPEGYPGASTKANSELLWSSTPKGYQEFARFVNEATGGSAAESGWLDRRPGDYQLLANFLTGSFGKFLTDSTVGFANKLDKGIEGPKDIPIIKEFFSDPSNPMMVQKYHTNIATIYGAHRLEQMYVKGPERDLIKLQEVREERGNELRMYAQAQDVERQLKSLRIRLRVAQNKEDTGREKELKERMNKVQEQFNKMFEQKVK